MSSLEIVVLTVVATLVVVVVALNFRRSDKRIEQRVVRRFALESAEFERELSVLLGPPVLGGNRFRVLLNGDQIFPPMLAAIRSAERTITFETYIYWSGAIGRAFADALCERARAGVAVHVLLDWIGSIKMDRALIEELEQAGVEVKRFHAPQWGRLSRLNNRTHRKLLVVDGRIGYTGGVGIAPSWTGRAQDPDHWRDTHFEVEGPVVQQMQSVFLDNWIEVSGDVLHGPSYFPAPSNAGEGRAQMFSSSPTGGSESMELMYLLAITAATRTIDLSAAYFVPDRLPRRALLEAIERGVRLRIVVPGRHIDSKIVRVASRADWGELLQAGASIAEFQPTMFHCKVMIVDGLLVSVGSTNFDNRSFRINDEATLNILDATFAAEQTAIFEQDLALSRPITYAQWLRRPLREKLAERVVGLISPEL